MTNKLQGKPVELPDAAAMAIDGVDYFPVFTYRAILEAKRILRRDGISINLLQALDAVKDLDADTLPALWYAALLSNHPKITYREAEAMITMHNFTSIYIAVCGAYAASVKEPGGKQENPPAEPEQ